MVSILHRISGALLFFPGIPLVLYSLHLLLQSPQDFEVLKNCLRDPLVKAALLLALWFFLHHLCAGIRHLFLDLHIGVMLPQARASSKWVLAAGLLLTVLAGVLLW